MVAGIVSVRMDGVVHTCEGWPEKRETLCGLPARPEHLWKGLHDPTCGECLDEMRAFMAMQEVDHPELFRLTRRLARILDKIQPQHPRKTH